jgi:hypothetical protein
MKINILNKVLITLSMAALLIVPVAFVILQTNNTKNAQAYNPYSVYSPYFDTNDYYQSHQNDILNSYPTNLFDPYEPYSTYYDANGEAVAASDFNQTVFDTNGNYSYSQEYSAGTNCNYYFSDNCSNFPLTPQPDYSNFVEQEPYIFNVPEPKTYNNYYNPYQENIQDPLKGWFPKGGFNGDKYYNS